MKRRMKQFMAIALVLLAALGCSACTNDVVGFVKVGAEMAALPQVEQTGTVKLNLDLTDEGLADWPADFTDVSFTFEAQSDTRKMQAKLAGELTAGKTTLPLTMYMDNVKLYFKADELIALYGLVAPEDTDAIYQLTTALGGAEWLCVDLMDDEAWEEYKSALLGADVATENIYSEAADLMSALSAPYSAFDSKLLTKKGNTYTLAFDNDSAINFINDFLLYSVENSEKIGAALAEWVDGCTLLNDEYKAEIKFTIYAGVSYAQSLTKENKADLTATLLTGAETWPFDCSVKYTLTRNSAKSFNVGYVIDYKETDTASISGISGLKLTANATSVAASNLKIAIPTVNVLNLDDMTANLTPDSVFATIYLDDDYMYYHHYYALPLLDESGANTPNVRIINSSTYLGLRAVAEACGEEVGWDSAKKSAYVVRGGDNLIYVAGYVDAEAGRTYLKIRDFEKLGYTVDYEKTEITGQIVTLSR